MKASLLSISSILLPLVASTPVLNVDIHISEDIDVSNSPVRITQPRGKNPTWANDLDLVKAEKIPGWAYFEGETFRARIHGNTFWNVKGKLKEPFPLDDFLFDPLLFTLNHPEDFSGEFNGTIGRGQISLTWEKSGATIVGRSPVGDFEVAGKSEIDYSP
ncbi:hypothetical protein BX600DRAFT_498942 [Xylariales sp. PMI_506]|nr:hypothetical protein BX600DRAFT_498942 [Xylariales sp. PMI_506]